MRDAYLKPGVYVESEDPVVADYVHQVTGCGKPGDAGLEPVLKLYYSVRDDFPYDPYDNFHDPRVFSGKRVLNWVVASVFPRQLYWLQDVAGLACLQGLVSLMSGTTSRLPECWSSTMAIRSDGTALQKFLFQDIGGRRHLPLTEHYASAPESSHLISMGAVTLSSRNMIHTGAGIWSMLLTTASIVMSRQIPYLQRFESTVQKYLI